MYKTFDSLVNREVQVTEEGIKEYATASAL